MEYNLATSFGVTFSFRNSGWRFFLKLAEKFGWQPEGTQKKKVLGLFGVWDGSYDSAEGQWVTASDAVALSEALTKALKSPELQNVVEAIAQEMESEFDKSFGEVPDEILETEEMSEIVESYQIPELEQQFVNAFISFCKMGSFSINKGDAN